MQSAWQTSEQSKRMDDDASGLRVLPVFALENWKLLWKEFSCCASTALAADVLSASKNNFGFSRFILSIFHRLLGCLGSSFFTMKGIMGWVRDFSLVFLKRAGSQYFSETMQLENISTPELFTHSLDRQLLS
jgi:hypothetical protein